MILGADTGSSGALVLLTEAGRLAQCLMMPTAMDGKRKTVDATALVEWLRQYPIEMAFIEAVNSFGQGRTSAFSFGRSYGMLEAAIAALDIPYARITPQEWKKFHGLIGQDKDAARLKAKGFWPECKTLQQKIKGQAVADAALIADYGRCKRDEFHG